MNPARLVFAVLPLVLLAGLVTVFAVSLERDPDLVRSALIDRPAPDFSLPPLEGVDLPGFDTASLRGEPTLVNVFASWCVPCREEHPLLTAVAEHQYIRLFGINHSDAPENARAFLEELGNPYDAIGVDRDRRVSIDWGVYGVPETFLVDADGIIRFKHVGPLTPTTLERDLLPALEALTGTP
jgi:cytochrome c biogenesis protein CcmG/thiol:disulfide interchange protein DsbE